MASNKLLKSLTYAGIILSVSSSFMGVTTLAVNAQDNSDVVKASKGISTKVDDSELQAAITAAKKQGLTVDEKTKDVTVSAEDTKKTSDDIKADYAKQAKDINEKTAKYKAEKDAYDKIKNDAGSSVIDSNKLINNLKLGQEKNAKMSLHNLSSDVTNSGVKSVDDNYKTYPNYTGARVFSTIANSTQDVVLTNNQKGADMSTDVTYGGLENSSVTDENGKKHTIAKIERHITLKVTDDYNKNEPATLVIGNNPTDLAEYSHGEMTVQDKFYDENGTQIHLSGSGNYITVSSLNASYQVSLTDGTIVKDSKQVHHLEKARGIGDDVKPRTLLGSSVKDHSDGWLYSDKTNESWPAQEGTTWDVSKGNWDDSSSKYQYFGTGVLQIFGDDVSYQFDTKTGSPVTDGDEAWAQMSTVMPKTEIKAPVKPDLSANFTNLLSMPKVNKDVDFGTVNGNPSGSADGQSVVKGDELTYSLHASDLPAGRGKYTKVGYKDKLSDGFTYKSFKVFDTEGKDVTKNWKATNNKGTIEILENPTHANDDLNKDYKLATVDLYGTAGKDGVKLENTFDLILDDNDFPSNKVVTPTIKDTVKKDVVIGDPNTPDGTSVDGKNVLKGQHISYTFKNADLPANRAFTVSDMGIKDKLPDEVDFLNFKVFDGKTGKDITNQFTNKGKGKEFDIVAGKDALASANADKKSAFKRPIFKINVVSNKDGVSFDNTAQSILNKDTETSNKVHNEVPKLAPTKEDFDENGNNIDGKEVKPGSTVNYILGMDLTGITNTAVSSDMLEKGLSISDDYDETKLDVTEDVKKNLTGEISPIDDESDSNKSSDGKNSSSDKSSSDSNSSSKNAKSSTQSTTNNSTTGNNSSTNEDVDMISKGTAKKFSMDDVQVSWDDKAGKLVISARDTKDFLNKYAGYKINFKFSPIVKADATGTLENTAIQNSFGDNTNTNKVTNDITPDAKPEEKELSHTGTTNKFGELFQNIMNLLNK